MRIFRELFMPEGKHALLAPTMPGMVYVAPMRPCLAIILLFSTFAACAPPTPRTAAERPQEYKSTARTQQLLRDDLSAIAGKEATVQAIELPPGWIGEKHLHTGDVFVYVQEGRLVVDVSGQGQRVVEAGQAYHEALNTVMQAWNGADGKPTRLLLFQVGGKNEPLMLRGTAE